MCKPLFTKAIFLQLNWLKDICTVFKEKAPASSKNFSVYGYIFPWLITSRLNDFMNWTMGSSRNNVRSDRFTGVAWQPRFQLSRNNGRRGDVHGLARFFTMSNAANGLLIQSLMVYNRFCFIKIAFPGLIISRNY